MRPGAPALLLGPERELLVAGGAARPAVPPVVQPAPPHLPSSPEVGAACTLLCEAARPSPWHVSPPLPLSPPPLSALPPPSPHGRQVADGERAALRAPTVASRARRPRPRAAAPRHTRRHAAACARCASAPLPRTRTSCASCASCAPGSCTLAPNAPAAPLHPCARVPPASNQDHLCAARVRVCLAARAAAEPISPGTALPSPSPPSQVRARRRRRRRRRRTWARTHTCSSRAASTRCTADTSRSSRAPRAATRAARSSPASPITPRSSTPSRRRCGVRGETPFIGRRRQQPHARVTARRSAAHRASRSNHPA